MKKIYLLFLLGLIFDRVCIGQVYLIPDAQTQPAWVFPLWFENGDGQKDTLYFCYDPQSVSNGYSDDTDTLMGEKLIKVSPAEFNMTFDAIGINDSVNNKVDVNYDLSIAQIDIFSQGFILPVKLKWDPHVFYSDSLQFPDLDPAPKAEGRMWFNIPTEVDSCSFDYPILMTDTIIGYGISCSKSDSIIFNGDWLSVLTFYVRSWHGIVLEIPIDNAVCNCIWYSNPVETQLTIQFESFSPNVRFELYDFFGRKIMSQGLDNIISQIDLSRLTTGVYYFILSGDNHIFEINKFLKI